MCMYIAKLGNHFHIKRMPNTGKDHYPGCPSYEPPPEISGLYSLLDSAIQEIPEEGITKLKLDFRLNKSNKSNNSGVETTDINSQEIKADPTKLTIKALLHHLYDRARLNYWYPKMNGKRGWYTIHKYMC